VGRIHAVRQERGNFVTEGGCGKGTLASGGDERKTNGTSINSVSEKNGKKFEMDGTLPWGKKKKEV